MLYIAGIVQLRNDTPGRACYRRKLQQSKTSMEAMRCLRRRTLDSFGTAHLTNPFIEGSHDRAQRSGLWQDVAARRQYSPDRFKIGAEGQ